MTPDERARLLDDVKIGKRWTGTYDADTVRDYYPAMDRIFAAVPALLDEIERARAEADRWRQAYEETVELMGRSNDALVERLREARATQEPTDSEVEAAKVALEALGLTAFDGHLPGLAEHAARIALSASRRALGGSS